MKLRVKTLLIVGVTAIVMSMVLGAAMYVIVNSSYTEIEGKNINSEMRGVVKQLEQEETRLVSTSSDWSSWDDTYSFVNDLNQDYIQGNLQSNAFNKLNINFMLFYNSSDALVYAAAFNLEQNARINLSDKLFAYIKENSNFLLAHSNLSYTRHGLFFLGENEPAYLVAMTPILQSNNTGPIQGTLIMGNLLDEDEIKSIEDFTELDIKFLPPSSQLIENTQKSQTLLNGQPVYFKLINSSYAKGYWVLDDILGAPAFAIEVGSNRVEQYQGFLLIQNLVFTLLFSIVIFIGLNMVVLDRLVTSRLQSLTDSVDEIKESKDLTKKLYIKGDDEISALEKSFDTMLTSLHAAWALRDLTELSLKKKVQELERFKSLTVDREIRMTELKKQLNDLRIETGRKT